MAKCCDRDTDGDGNCPWHPDGVAIDDIPITSEPEPVTEVENCVIFGEADNATRAQMRSMLGGEEGALGVLCADNHLGYGMPIGGVVAYRNHVTRALADSIAGIDRKMDERAAARDVAPAFNPAEFDILNADEEP